MQHVREVQQACELLFGDPVPISYPAPRYWAFLVQKLKSRFPRIPGVRVIP